MWYWLYVHWKWVVAGWFLFSLTVAWLMGRAIQRLV